MSARLFALGAAVAVGGLMMIPGVASAVTSAGRPIVRRGLKGGAAAYEGLKRAAGEAYEHFEDLAAEVRAEMEAEAGKAGEAAGAAADAGGTAGAAAEDMRQDIAGGGNGGTGTG